ncbi:MAG TPA: DUF4126 domain-containing protein [Syntrophorhabdaceae bacterium]|nr:DUF4126 domain-containing protein [Syntrophorhabdaceae bacterium]HOD74513.1 DUF4126 domain-containing protein [Syntrophorhabdaceae bacterium]
MDLTREQLEMVFAVLTGIGLSAACGFRIFLPLLALNLASMYGLVGLAPGFEWIAGYQVTMAFGIATVLEIVAYYIPWLDNIMDSIASPVSVIAGTIATASLITDIPSSLKWTISIVAGGGIAGLLQGATVALRAKSTIFTAGLGNFLVASFELLASAIVAFLSLILPIAAFILALLLITYCLILARRVYMKKKRGRGEAA